MSRHGLTLPRGLPGELPRGEKVLWCGGPDGPTLTRYAMHVRKFAVYFVLLLAWRLYAVWHDGFTAAAAVSATVTTLLLAGVVIGVLWLYGRVSARTTQYTITNERVVIRTGVALSIAVNLPFGKIVSADAHRRDDGTGDIALTLADGNRVGYAILWPSAKPFRFAHPVPMLRAIRDVDRIAVLLASALAHHAGAKTAARSDDEAPSHGALAAG